jgi:hypothetical protein
VTFLHELPDFADLVAVVARNESVDPGLVEKDYWIMHCLWGLQQGGFVFELKGGTSLSRGFKLINRISEDIDILIYPPGDLPVVVARARHTYSSLQCRFCSRRVRKNCRGQEFRERRT